MEEPEKPEYLTSILEMIHAIARWLFSTDYPHWDNDFSASDSAGNSSGSETEDILPECR